MSMPEKAYKNLDFLASPSARHIRILCEYEEPRQRFLKNGIHNTIVFFGSARTLSSEVMDALVVHDWPGNVRELEAVLLRAAALADVGAIEVKDLPANLRSRAAIAEVSPPVTSLTYREVLAAGRERTTRDYLVALLAAVGGNVTQAAERAGVERETFHRLLKRHGIRAEDFRSR